MSDISKTSPEVQERKTRLNLRRFKPVRYCISVEPGSESHIEIDELQTQPGFIQY
ncbi:hypothetical protein SAMD00023353_1001430 [Rosellinia necatrix]|uniref:Uncharacterized protein n=1 Tax=Rosellinia necatrix TaxID=77044 RepID=A0A1S8A6F4_ROSNE|nr:hypothetical protein SAMD00023353_1001430 [Rosellinia necatrix]